MKSKIIADYLGCSLSGEDIEIKGFSSLSNITQDCVVFANKVNSSYVDLINSHRVLSLVCEGYEGKLQGTYIVIKNPRLAFAKVVQKFFLIKTDKGIHASAVVEEGASLGDGVSVGANSYIGPEVSIGSHTVIMPNVTIIGKVRIGEDCLIEPGTVLGGEGFGYEYDEDGIPVHFPHTGDIIVGNNVCIGSNTCIDRGTIDSTIIEDNVKIDNLVHIGHNVHIKENAFIIAGAIICGGTEVGKNCWISPNSSLHQKVVIGDMAKVGMGSAVIGRVRPGQTVFGVPAKKL